MVFSLDKMRVYLLVFLFFPLAVGGQTAKKDKQWALVSIEREDDFNPILEPDRSPEFFCPIRKRNIEWQARAVYNPTAVVKDGRVWLFFRAQDKVGEPAGTSRIGIGSSRSGLEFKSNPIPVVFPSQDNMQAYEWAGGCEDPRIVKREDSTYVMTYTAYDGKVARLAVATSRDLMLWEKKGLAFREKKHRDLWSKSGAIVCSLVNGEIVAQKIKGKYWMYWGDTDIFMATSEDLLEWEPVQIKRSAAFRSVLQPRPEFFDSKQVEPGPFALITPKGILLLYNGFNHPQLGDKNLPEHACSVGQALFSLKNPTKLAARSNQYFLTPRKSFEKNGQVENVCYISGMVWFKDRWMLYYGGADKRAGVAVCKPSGKKK